MVVEDAHLAVDVVDVVTPRLQATTPTVTRLQVAAVVADVVAVAAEEADVAAVVSRRDRCALSAVTKAFGKCRRTALQGLEHKCGEACYL